MIPVPAGNLPAHFGPAHGPRDRRPLISAQLTAPVTAARAAALRAGPGLSRRSRAPAGPAPPQVPPYDERPPQPFHARRHNRQFP
jgi:hypothetical protein